MVLADWADNHLTELLRSAFINRRMKVTGAEDPSARHPEGVLM